MFDGFFKKIKTVVVSGSVLYDIYISKNQLTISF